MDEHLKERGFFVEMDHQEAGKLRYPSVPFRFSKTESSTRVSAPLLGQHNDEVYGEGLGFSGEELARLRRGRDHLRFGVDRQRACGAQGGARWNSGS